MLPVSGVEGYRSHMLIGTHVRPFRLVTLGRVALETPDGEDTDIGRRRRKLALLAVLALSPEPLTRDALAQMFWGDEDPERARHSLSDALSHLRRILGRDAITGRSGVVQLNVQDRLAVDAVEMEEAVAAADLELARTLYAGRFLDGLVVPGSATFESWVTAAREKYEALHQRACLPPAIVDAVVERRTTPRRHIAGALLATAIAASIIGFIGAVALRPVEPPPAAAPVIALTDVITDPADTSLAWLAEGLKQMIAGDLGRVSLAGVVAPSIVREVAARRNGQDSLTVDARIAIARRLHADWAASASVKRHGAEYSVSFDLRHVTSDTRVQRFTVTGTNILAVADQAATKMLTALEVGGTGPVLSDVETNNTNAYRHFIRSEELHTEGAFEQEVAELDSAIAADSGFTSALAARMRVSEAAIYRRLKPLFDRARPRMTQWDYLSNAMFDANGSGQPRRAELMARQLVARYPRDPRALRALGQIYTEHAMYPAADSAYTRLVDLDSAAAQNSGPCWACDGFVGRETVAHLRGDGEGEVNAARRVTVLRPASSSAWQNLASALQAKSDAAGAAAAMSRYTELVGDTAFNPFIGRMLVVNRKFDEAESYARRYLTSRSRDDAYDIIELVLRERGQFRQALDAFRVSGAAGSDAGLNLVYAHTLAATGKDALACAEFERRTWHPEGVGPPLPPYGGNARGFTWHHALLADATWTRSDTSALRALADSIERIGAWSYYARDWQAYHHVRGLIFERAGKLSEAKREFELALALVRGWTRTNVELAKVDIALGAPREAIATLREAYREPLDAMGRYAPRSELDFLMSKAFARANAADSARVYATYVRAAWVHADPEFTVRLAELP